MPPRRPAWRFNRPNVNDAVQRLHLDAYAPTKADLLAKTTTSILNMKNLKINEWLRKILDANAPEVPVGNYLGDAKAWIIDVRQKLKEDDDAAAAPPAPPPGPPAAAPAHAPMPALAGAAVKAVPPPSSYLNMGPNFMVSCREAQQAGSGSNDFYQAPQEYNDDEMQGS